MQHEQMSQKALIRQWIEQCVVDLGLCPFARVPYAAGQVRLVIYDEASEAGFLQVIDEELSYLLANDNVETTLVAGPEVLSDFLDFNDFLDHAEALLEAENRADIIQLASFHPDYRFAGVAAEDAGNYTNRAPFPIIQWLRADSVTRAASGTDTLAIPDTNIARLKSMAEPELRARFPWVKRRS